MLDDYNLVLIKIYEILILIKLGKRVSYLES